MTASQYLLDTSREYAIYVCHTRAIPFVGDGLKHGQMIALWLLRDRADKIKTIALSGLMAFTRLYVHGDASANNLIGFLAAPYKNNVPLIEGLGEFGSRVSPDAIGAPRYTEVRRSRAAQAFLYNDLDILPLQDNYDGSNKQPKHFLPLIPIVLLNGVTGIAVGWSTNILPRSLKTLIEGTKQALLGHSIKLTKPNFERYDITVTQTGHNQWELGGRATVRDASTVQIRELPPGLTIEGFRRRLTEMEDAGQIQSYVDRSTDTIDIVVKMVRGTVSQWQETDAIEFFKLTERITERIVVIDWDGTAIRTYADAEALITDFVVWRLDWYTKRFEFFRRRDKAELTFWLALKALFDAKFPERLGSFADRDALQADVVSTVGFDLDEPQINRIVNLPTYRWTRHFLKEIEAKIASIELDIKNYESILSDPVQLRQIYLNELDTLRHLRLGD